MSSRAGDLDCAASEIVTDADLRAARALTALGSDAEARAIYLALLARDPTHFQGLTELGNLAYAGGYRSAARTAYEQAVLHHPGQPIGHVNLANLLRASGERAAAKDHFQAALEQAPDLVQAHQGLALILDEEGDAEAAAHHRHRGFSRDWLVRRPYRGLGPAPRILLLVSALGGNIPVEHWLADRRYDITAVYADYADPTAPLPAHDLIFNAIGDADLCPEALHRAERLCARTERPVINRPDRVRITGRADTARFGSIAQLRVPKMRRLRGPGADALAGFAMPVLLRRLGYHTGQHFLKIETGDALTEALAALDPHRTGEVLLVEYLNARGTDGLARKYRMMFIDGELYPLHLALARDWKVHYFTSDMSEDAAYRREEQRFLDDPAGVLGPGGIEALRAVAAQLHLDYAGIDFGLDADGRILVFEVNATMVLIAPDADPIWDYRRAAIGRAFEAAERMVADRLPAGRTCSRSALDRGDEPAGSGRPSDAG